MNYSSASIEKGYYDERPVLRVRGVTVEIGARTILVEWHEGAQWHRFEGVRSGQGHFLLRSDDARTKATLHRFPDSPILEGYWSRNGKSGFWRIHLPRNTRSKVIRLRGWRGRRLPKAA